MKLCFILLTFLSLSAHAVVESLTVSGVSYRDENPTTQAWGVFVGAADPVQTSTYNNCPLSLDTIGAFEGCHESRVNGNTSITVTFRETEEVTNARAIAVIRPINTGAGANRVVAISNNTSTGTNQTASITFTWERLCNLITNADGSGAIVSSGGKLQCEINNTSVSGKFLINFGFESSIGSNDTSSTRQVTFNLYQPNPGSGVMNPSVAGCGGTAGDGNFGFCNIAVFPGDEGGFVIENEEPTDPQNQIFSNSNSRPAQNVFGDSDPINVTVESLRLYVSSESFEQAQPVNANTQSIDFRVVSFAGNNIANFEDNSFSGLTNGTTYFARAATIDTSRTISQLMDESLYCPSNNCPQYTFTPSEVAGIIAESSCFITTVAYGSPQAHQVHLFRKFRANYLWTNFLGHIISDFYDAYGPYAAAWIKRNPKSKSFARLALYPFYGFAYLSLQFGFIIALITYVLGFASLIFGIRKIKGSFK